MSSLLILFACSEQKGKPFEYQGGSVSMCLDYEMTTYNPYMVEDYYSATVMRHVLEGLVSIDLETSKIKPQIAASWSVSDDGLEYTFELRNDVYFHEHPAVNKGRVLNATDVIKSFEYICRKNEKGMPNSAFLFAFSQIIAGADDYFEGKQKSISGIQAQDNKITIKLISRNDNFLYKLASVQMAILPHELIEANDVVSLIGTGPFIINEIIEGEVPKVVLTRNENYYELDAEGHQLPYLDSLTFYVQNKKLEQLDMFESHQIDMIIGLPTSRITKMLDGRLEDFNSVPPKLFLNKNPVLVTNYYFFNLSDPRFEDARVRQAFNLAINREKIGREILRNQYEELGIYGIVPPVSSTFKGYNFESVRKSSYGSKPNIAKARKLLADAGYPNGKGFGSVNLRFNIGDINSAVADEFAQQIFQVLNINVNIDGSTFDQLQIDAVQGNGDIFRYAWTADFPNPETFLDNFFSKNIGPKGSNVSKYKNQKFDNFLSEAKMAENRAEKLKYYASAEVELMKDPPIIPLWYSGDLQIIYSDIRNLKFNAMNVFDFKSVYRKPWTAEEYQKSIQGKE